MGVYAKVVAYNYYGDSLSESNLGNGAIIVFVPDHPLALRNDPLITNAF